MYLYLYCITTTLYKKYLHTIGIENARVIALPYNNITAIVSKLKTNKISTSKKNVLHHAAVIDAINKDHTVIPLRFSSVFNNDTAVLKFLETRYKTFLSDLQRLHDKYEMGLRVITGGYGSRGRESASAFRANKSPPSSGTDYLEQKRNFYVTLDKEELHIREITEICQEQFKDIYTEFIKDTSAGSLPGISLNYLIHKDLISKFKVRCTGLRMKMKGIQVICSGPWPPYHFVS